MFKRLAISYSLVLAFAMLQAHNYIPHHHHHQKDIETHHHHHHSHDHENDDNTDDNKSPLQDIAHNAEFGKVITKPDFSKEVIQLPALNQGLLIRLYDKLASFEKPPPPNPPDDDSPLHIIFISHSIPLRAPPASCIS